MKNVLLFIASMIVLSCNPSENASSQPFKEETLKKFNNAEFFMGFTPLSTKLQYDEHYKELVAWNKLTPSYYISRCGVNSDHSFMIEPMFVENKLVEISMWGMIGYSSCKNNGKELCIVEVLKQEYGRVHDTLLGFANISPLIWNGLASDSQYEDQKKCALVWDFPAFRVLALLPKWYLEFAQNKARYDNYGIQVVILYSVKK